MKRKYKRLIIICLTIVILLFGIVPLGLAAYVYDMNFGNRYETESYMSNALSDFDGLQATKHTFPSNKGQMLAGYNYYKEGSNKKGVIVLAHGLGGGGHNSYMDVIDYFTTHGYYVFAFDATGNDESEGEKVGGLPQMVIDLNHALDYISQDDVLQAMPKVLWGQSWGGYGVSSVLNIRDDIQAVISVSGFNGTQNLLEEQGREQAGDMADVLMPYFAVTEWLKYGPFSTYTSLDGYEGSDARVMIIHSVDDDMISIENSFDVYHERFKDDERFTFIKYDNRGHNYTYYTDASSAYIHAFDEAFKAYRDSKDEKLTAQEKAAYMEEHLDRAQAFELDEEIMGQMVAFYDESLSGLTD